MPTLTLTPLTPGSLATKQTGVYNVMEYGAIGDGSHDDTVAIQQAFSAAATRGTVYFPAGTWYTGTVQWQGQSIMGAGIGLTNIKGKPGQDVFHADGSLSADSRQFPSIENLTITVDDSTDASSSFSTRGGVGNAGFAFDYADGSLSQPLRFSQARVERVRVQGLSTVSGGQNKSVGFYFQSPPNLSRFRDIIFYRLAYGYWDHFPTSNLTAVEFYSDHNHFDSLYCNACGSAIRFVNHASAVVTNLVIHGSGTNGFQGVGQQSASRSNCFNIQFDGVMIENVTSPWSLTGEGHSVHDVSITGGTGTVTFAASYSFYDSVAISTSDNNPILTVTGNRNRIQGLRRADSPTSSPVVTDSGTRNSITSVAAQVPTVSGSRGGNAALASLLTGLAASGFVIDSSS